MEWFHRSLFNKVLAINVAGAVTIALATVFFLIQVASVINNYQALITHQIENRHTIAKLDSIFQQQGKTWKTLLVRGGKESVREKYWKEFLAFDSTWQQEIEKFHLEALPDAKQTFADLRESYKEMVTDYRKAYERFSASNGNVRLGDSVSKGKDRKVSQLIGELIQASEEATTSGFGAVQSGGQRALLTSAGILFVSIALFTVVNVFVSSQSYVNPAVELANVVSRQSKGQLDDEVFIHRKDEIGLLADAARRLKRFLGDVRDYLLNTHGGLTNSAQIMEAATSSAVSEVNQAQSQTDQITQSTETLKEVAEQVSENATRGADIATEADRAAREAVNGMTSAEKGIERLDEQLSTSVVIVNELQAHADNVGAVLSVIQDIAEQTNLLALNAAIEAARAGEQGRGFAVVADEVRSLANKTQTSTEEIEQMIANVQAGSQKTVETMLASQKITQEAAGQFVIASKNLRLIAENIGQLSRINLNVSDHVLEQTQLSDQIIEHLHAVVGLIEKVTQELEETRGVAGEVKKVAGQAQNLLLRFEAGI